MSYTHTSTTFSDTEWVDGVKTELRYHAVINLGDTLRTGGHGNGYYSSIANQGVVVGFNEKNGRPILKWEHTNKHVTLSLSQCDKIKATGKHYIKD